MLRLQQYLRSAETVLRTYNGEAPFTAWLKEYFRQNKKFGSKDRKAVAELCFCFYRLGAAWKGRSVEDRLLLGQALCRADSPFVTELRPQWLSDALLPVDEKAVKLTGEEAPHFFPFGNELSEEIDGKAFNLSMLVQPDVFLRARPKKLSAVLQKLSAAGIAHDAEGDCIAVPTGSRVDDFIALDKEAVVQDKSSQQVLNGWQDLVPNSSFAAWDCCAASGGKSILLHDRYPGASLTVSDVRESILHNLRSRFKRAGIGQYKAFVADVGSPQFSLSQTFDLIVCDAPCSGSGTWARTPEQLHFFQREKIDHYTDLQLRIATNASRYLNQGGCLVYATCSVFEKENEDVVWKLVENTGLTVVSQQYHKGYNEKADTLFSAVLRL